MMDHLHVFQQCMGIPAASRTHPHLVFLSVYFILTILLGASVTKLGALWFLRAVKLTKIS